MMNQNCHTKAARAALGETLLMTAMVSFAPITLCAMMFFASAL